MSKSSKKLISQRWDEKFSAAVKQSASKLNISSTELTVESLLFMIDLVSTYPEEMIDRSNRSKFLKSLMMNQDGNMKSEDAIDAAIAPTGGAREAGYVIDRIANYIEANHNQTFSTTELSEVLNIPQSTVRTNIRKLVIRDANYRLIPGRPNFIGYYKS